MPPRKMDKPKTGLGLKNDIKNIKNDTQHLQMLEVYHQNAQKQIIIPSQMLNNELIGFSEPSR